ncbi:hypothetical protein Cylst_2552 [Cylindrospermum stagnale PCC 7417]|uniref:Uncharacterized protein n=1 Tax=Cylindrospermum stagnale PCC 7417 TaxID=56107 RepID=K9WY61_9NOST|nr:hypothetical protein [Cylindrospermum stagnale]AFZ24759.1 hypothetical protein Cylst_2552 [Cylindrospermum stagnale PCC 7417]
MMTKYSDEEILTFAKSEIKFYLTHESAHPNYEYDDDDEIISDDIGCTVFSSCTSFEVKDAAIDPEHISGYENCVAGVIVTVDWSWSSEDEDEPQFEEDVELLIEIYDVDDELSANRREIERV